jgi:hypothetical protein
MKYLKIPNFITEDERESISSFFNEHKYSSNNIIMTSAFDLVRYDDLTEDANANIWSLILEGDSELQEQGRSLMIDISKRIKDSFNFNDNIFFNRTPRGLPFLLECQIGHGLIKHTDPTHSSDCSDAIYDLPADWDLMRGNILINKPEGGGSLYLTDEQGFKHEISLEERELILFSASMIPHEVSNVEGNKTRLMYVTSIGVERASIENLNYLHQSS